MRLHSLFASLVAGVAFGGISAPGQAACIDNPVTQPDASFPVGLTGKLAYHAYMRYGDGTSQIFIYDFSARTLTQVSKRSWNIRDPMNAVFSPDGKWLAFMGVSDNAWNVFLWQVGSTSVPVNMTHSTGQTRNEDPKFSADGTSLFFKRNGDIVRAGLSFTSHGPAFASVVDVTGAAGSAENSMPFPAPDGSAVYLTIGSGANMGLYKQMSGTGTKVSFDTPAGISTYYPAVRADGTVFYARWKDRSSRLDQIYAKVNPGDTADQLSINDCSSSNSDPSPVDNTGYVFFSSTTRGGYQLYLGDLKTGKRWSLSQFGVNADVARAKLGSSYYSGVPLYPKTLLSQRDPALASARATP